MSNLTSPPPDQIDASVAIDEGIEAMTEPFAIDTFPTEDGIDLVPIVVEGLDPLPTVPAPPIVVDDSDPVPIAPITPESKHILLIDDTRAVLDIHAMELQCYGYRCTTVLGAEDGFRALKQGDYDVVLCDYMMPKCNGHELAAKFREWEALHCSGPLLPIYGLTAYATEDIRQRCLEGGMQGVIVKPLQAKDVFGILQYHFAKRKNSAGFEHP